MEWVALGLLLILLQGGKEKASTPTSATISKSPSSGDDSKPSYAERVTQLRTRAATGSRWVEALRRNAPVGFEEWAAAVARWAGIESGGDPTNVTGGKEVGLLQIDRDFAKEQGFTSEELDRYASKDATDDERAILSWRYVQALDKGHPTPWDDQERQWRAYMAHALPSMFRDLADKGFLAEPDGPRPGGILDTARDKYTPSDTVARFATFVGPKHRQLLARFVAPCDVVAAYDRKAWL